MLGDDIMEKSLYNKFKQDLGISDAINEYIEVLLRQFEKSPHNESSFQSIASEFGIRVNDVSPQTAIQKIREYYIITVYQVFEDFLSKMHSFLKKYGKYNKNKDRSISMLQNIHGNLIGMRKTSETPYLCYLICDYYRLVRNLCAHTDNIDKVQKAYQKLIERRGEIEVLFKQLQAPNEYGSICFDDFILYSRAAKKLAELYTENVVYDVDKIIDNFDIKRLHIYKNNIARLRNAIETELKFNFCMKPEIIKNVIDKLVQKI